MASKNSTLFYSLKILLISTGVLSILLILRLFVPVIFEFLVLEVPVLWTSFRSWLTPPYLYVVLNCIIITIAASSRFQNKVEQKQQVKTEITAAPAVKVTPDDAVVTPDFLPVVLVSSDYDDVLMLDNDMGFYSQPETMVLQEEKVIMPEDDMKELSRSMCKLNRNNSVELPMEYSADKPPVSSRFANRKSANKGNPEARKAPRVAKPKQLETLESTWKTITEGRQIPLARHLKKSDTWEKQGHQLNMDLTDPLSTKMQKAETFIDRSSNYTNSSLLPSEALSKLKRDPSLSQDELNRKVEEFIKKFNEDMRLQRQESLKKYMEMTNGGVH
ncbi:hypothetical protein GIB67_031235 [Kingdonia uniflora]|uniref:DUF4408 domain-containing protein n=1 Tax=Kingdonia uniflora TaxID=39325 RepID=A0A7J7NL27_9MAGN|nr:hypothetical protein GIB67_031235 [Kingdonia uniflora]